LNLGTMSRVLDTAALLMWPVQRLAGGTCAVSQKTELERVNQARSMLIDTLELDWRDVSPAWLGEARRVAAASGDLPRLSDVDVDVLALAIGLDATLVTDDFRLRNAFSSNGGHVEAAGVKKTTNVWAWAMHCTGCGVQSDVPEDVPRSKKDDVGSCDRCGSPLTLKRKRKR